MDRSGWRSRFFGCANHLWLTDPIRTDELDKHPAELAKPLVQQSDGGATDTIDAIGDGPFGYAIVPQYFEVLA